MNDDEGDGEDDGEEGEVSSQNLRERTPFPAPTNTWTPRKNQTTILTHHTMAEIHSTT
jgi:hypothetical protein